MARYKVSFGMTEPEETIIIDDAGYPDVDLWNLIGIQYPEIWDRFNECHVYEIIAL